MRSRRTTRSRSRGSRRKLVWATRSVAPTVTTNAEVTNIDLLADYKAVAGASTAGITIMRTHLAVWPTATITRGDSFVLGLKVDDIDQVVASSASALAVSPVGNPETDWMFIQEYIANPTYAFEQAANNIRIDLRAKRRMEEVQEAYLLSVATVGIAAGGLPFGYAIYCRTLLALP